MSAMNYPIKLISIEFDECPTLLVELCGLRTRIRIELGTRDLIDSLEKTIRSIKHAVAYEESQHERNARSAS